jgi:ribosome-associated toxin RatA of RatAB toxin-antitoxin module
LAELITEHTFEATEEQAFAGIRRYSDYPEYLPGVQGVEVLPAKVDGSVCQVRYDLKFIKTFYYTLNMFENSPNKIWWNLDESNIMKVSNGSWTLKSNGKDKTDATYSLDVAFKGLVPQKIVDQITKANLPLMMKGFQKLIDKGR